MKVAVVLTNLGGPDSMQAVRPFLFNLFYDPAILQIPNPFRYLLAQLISRTRKKKSQAIYEKMGGKSPILANTLKQANALQFALNDSGHEAYVIPAMRHWRPFTKDAAESVRSINPDKIILLPLYPQFSVTTTESSIDDWKKNAPDQAAKTIYECCYFVEPSFIQAHVDTIVPYLQKAAKHGVPKILFSAHSLPQKVIDKGDPYQVHVEATVGAIMKELRVVYQQQVNHTICYQSKVGPIPWLGPPTEKEIEKSGDLQEPIVVVPIAFVSEHSETLVELDMDYYDLAVERGVPYYGRVPALGDHPLYIQSLKNRVLALLDDKPTFGPCCQDFQDPLKPVLCWRLQHPQ